MPILLEFILTFKNKYDFPLTAFYKIHALPVLRLTNELAVDNFVNFNNEIIAVQYLLTPQESISLTAKLKPHDIRHKRRRAYNNGK